MAEKLAELRLGRKGVVAREEGVVAREEGEGEEGGGGSVMEHKSLPQRQGSVALTPGTADVSSARQVYTELLFSRPWRSLGRGCSSNTGVIPEFFIESFLLFLTHLYSAAKS